MGKYSKRQIVILVLFIWSEFCMALACSLQAPFYPHEAEKKGARPSEYGFVFGVYELVVFLFCPIFGKFLGSLGVEFVTNAGIVVVGVTCTLFGFLTMVNNVIVFIAYSFAIRILEGIGYAAFTTAIFSIIAQEFPDDVGATFAGVETFFGLGLILGPTIGGALYEVGGYLLPFVVVGSCLLFGGVLIYFLLPPQRAPISSSNSHGLLFLLKKPPFVFGTATVFCTAYSIGFVQAILEPHLRALHLSMFHVSLIFIINGITYFFLAPIFGKICDSLLSPHVVMTMGTVFVAVGFLIMGPAPFLPLKMSLKTIISSLVVTGVGNGATLISSFSGFHKDALAFGLSDDISTYGIVSGHWMSTFALGAFIGPSAAGVLFDLVGFPWASLTVVGLHTLLFLTFSLYLCFSYFTSRKNPEADSEEASLVNSNDVSIKGSYHTI